MSLLTIPSFTNVGYWLHSRDHHQVDADMSGQTVVITGGTGGLGRAGAEAIAGLGARTVVIGRSTDKLSAAESEIAGDVIGHEADLSLMSEIRDLAERLLERERRIDVLINNVGVLLPELETTDEGLEKTFATDLAGHFLFTNLLIPRLVESAPARIVNMTSGGMYSERIRPDDLQFERREYKGTSAYAHAKRGQVILTGMWAEQLEGTGVSVHVMHPGWANTAGVARSLPIFDILMRPLLRSAEQGADTMVWLAAAPEPAQTSGELWFDRETAPKHLLDRTREDESDRRRLWQALVEATGSDFPALPAAET
ncbi:MAG TPA: SDR family NAD(P)-dependent oxidoreductase [Acidimicrobiia bacterium]|nr:SDR family NAD(P)-dependent oxidoreductase [Acidimicrobiia bacterium]